MTNLPINLKLRTNHCLALEI